VRQPDGSRRNGGIAAAAAETAEKLARAAELNATLDWSQELLEAEAARVEKMPTPGPLAGMPLALKDNIVTVEQETTCGSRILEGYLSPYNATVVERLRAAGAEAWFAADMAALHGMLGNGYEDVVTDEVSALTGALATPLARFATDFTARFAPNAAAAGGQP